MSGIVRHSGTRPANFANGLKLFFPAFGDAKAPRPTVLLSATATVAC